jgi:hypothetical protein
MNPFKPEHLNRLMPLLLIGILSITAGCNRSRGKQEEKDPLKEEKAALANEMEESLFKYILEPWYPRDIDTVNGGYISSFNRDWTL